MPIAPSNFCTTIDGMSTDVTGTLSRFMKKKIQLQRLAQLMYTSGLQVPLPNIDKLLPLSAINFEFYNQLKVSCPMLGLPSQTPSSLAELQALVRNAYQTISDGLAGHPFSQLGGMQDQLNELLGMVNGLIGQSGFNANIFECLQSACQGYSQLGVYSDQYQQQTLRAFESMYQELGPDYGNVLTETTQGALDQVNAIRDGVTDLINE